MQPGRFYGNDHFNASAFNRLLAVHCLGCGEVDMGKIRQHPKYNVLSCRASDAEWEEIDAVIGNGNRSAFLLEAALEKVRRERQRRVDHVVSERAL